MSTNAPNIPPGPQRLGKYELRERPGRGGWPRCGRRLTPSTSLPASAKPLIMLISRA